MRQTVIQIGNSLGVTIPSEQSKKMKLKKGQRVYVAFSKTPIEEQSVTPKFLNILEKVNKKYKSTFAELAEK